MTRKAFDKIAGGLKDAAAFASHTADPTSYRVQVPSEIDVKAIRRALKLTQTAFCSRFGFPLSTLRDWEQGRGRPDTSARVLLLVIAREPQAVERALQAA